MMQATDYDQDTTTHAGPETGWEIAKPVLWAGSVGLLIGLIANPAKVVAMAHLTVRMIAAIGEALKSLSQ